MNLRDDLNALTPRLRRYARALSTGHAGGSDVADDLVHAALMRALGSRNLGTHGDLIIRLYATVTQLYRDIAPSESGRVASSPKPLLMANQASGAQATALFVRQSKLTLGLMSLALEDREALLLVALENFDHGEAARILKISRGVLFTRLSRGRIALSGHLQGQAARFEPEPERTPYLRLVKST